MASGSAQTESSAAEHRHLELRGAFGNDSFGRLAEKAARFFGTPQYIVGQTVAVLVWVILNSTQVHLGFAWDVYPFIALNLLFSLQAAYAAPLILLAQTRQADRDKLHTDMWSRRATPGSSMRRRRRPTSSSSCFSRTPSSRARTRTMTRAGRGADESDPRPAGLYPPAMSPGDRDPTIVSGDVS